MFVTSRRCAMTTKAGVGMSRHHNPNVAGREAAEQALEKAGIVKPDFVFMFASIGYDQHSLVRAVRETTRGAPLSGCSAEGTINGDDAEVVSDGVSYALLSGKAQASWSISHSLIPIGGERKVTRSHGNVIYEIDGKPALEVLGEYLPEDARADERDWMRYAISLALCFRAPNYMKDEEYVVRGVPQPNLSDGSVTVQSEVKEGTSVWFSSRDKEKLATGLDRMAVQIKEQLGGEKPKLVFQFECATRGKMMFRDREKLQLLKRFRQSVGPDVPWAGFYTIGEIGPVEEHNLRHLYTSVVLALS